MSMCKCYWCEDVFDTDIETENDGKGNPLCDKCHEEKMQRDQDEADMPGGFF